MAINNQVANVGCQLMMICGFLLFAYFPREVYSETDVSGSSKDVCLFESFQPQCLKNEAILMQTATYGRMRIGRCITAEEVAVQRSLAGDDLRLLGCSEDVLLILDKKCSGKVACDIRVNDISDEKIQPCFPGLKMYLEIDYRCINVVDEERSCVVTASANSIHIVNPSDSQRICGQTTQPWMLEAPTGQKLRISVIYFGSSLSVGQTKGQLSDSCQNQGVIVDKVMKRNASICVGGRQREAVLYLSSGNTLELYLSLPNLGQERDRDRFILKVTAVGCSDIIPPEETWLKRKDDTIQIGCYSSRQTWQLTCRGGTWAGVLGNCTQNTHDSSSRRQEVVTQIKPSLSVNGQVLAIIAISGFTLAICLMIICIGAVCLRRYYVNIQNKQEYKTLNYSTRSQQRMVNSGVIADCFNGSTIHGVIGQQMPTYSGHEEQDICVTSATHSA